MMSKKCEYMVDTKTYDGNFTIENKKEEIEYLNNLGSQGWELVSVKYYDVLRIMYYFKIVTE